GAAARAALQGGALGAGRGGLCRAAADRARGRQRGAAAAAAEHLRRRDRRGCGAAGPCRGAVGVGDGFRAEGSAPPSPAFGGRCPRRASAATAVAFFAENAPLARFPVAPKPPGYLE